MLMIFFEKDKILSDDQNIRMMNAEYFPKPSIGEKVVVRGVMYMVCDVTINYDEHQIIVIVDRV